MAAGAASPGPRGPQGPWPPLDHVYDSWSSWEVAEARLAWHGLSRIRLAELRQGWAFAMRHHGRQRRPSGAPYAQHLLETIEVLVEGPGVLRREVLLAALLHDVVEDTPCTVEDVRDRFGPEVAELVGWVTKPPTLRGQERLAVREAYLARLAEAPADAVLVKLADRLGNVQKLENLPGEARRERYYHETVRWILPLAATVPDGAWFAGRYAAWRERWRHLEHPRPT
jgi:(p)ppGpp synthase/HD superfamily hydrolase